MTRRLLLLALTLAAAGLAQSRDGGTPRPELSTSECDALVEHLVGLALTESLAEDPDVKKLPPKEREVAERLARREAKADPKLAELKKQCPARYDKKAEQCLLKAKTMREADACQK